MSTDIDNEGHAGHEQDGRPDAVRRADTGSQAWRAVVHAQRRATLDHGDFYTVVGELVDTLRSLDGLTGLLSRQVADYPSSVIATGRRLYDDEGANPDHRVRAAVLALAETRAALSAAERAADQLFAQLSHIGTEAGR